MSIKCVAEYWIICFDASIFYFSFCIFLFLCRERNKFLARKTRVKKKAEVENLWAQVNQLRTENERLKEAVRVSNPKPAEEILSNCHFVLPKKVVDFVDGMVAEDQDAELDLKSSRCFCITNATAPDDPIVYASPDFVELTGYAMHSILGHNCRFLQGPDTDKNEVGVYRIFSSHLVMLA